MSEFKRLEMDHKGLPFVDDNGVYVLYENYAELKAQRDALAAENGLLLNFDLDDFREGGPYQPADQALDKLKTPATDAYLNSVRAEGADKVAEYHFVRIDALKDVSRQGHLFHKAAYSDAVNVANLFRAGKDGE